MTSDDKTVDLAENLWKRLRAGKPPAKRHPQICGDIPMSIGRDGTWYYQGGPIGRIELVKLFATVLQRDEDGGHWLVTPAEMARIEVEDAAFVVVEMACEGAGKDAVIRFRTNIDQWVDLDEDHGLRIVEDAKTGEPSPYIGLDRGLEARLNRATYYHLVDHAVEVPDVEAGKLRIGIYSKGKFFEIGSMELPR